MRKIYFAANVKTITGRPDFVFRKKKLAVFIDSDFWHGHPKRCIMPKSNRRYWNAKIEGNRCRDRLVNRLLSREGWTVVRIWEHDLQLRFSKAMDKIITRLVALKPRPRTTRR